MVSLIFITWIKLSQMEWFQLSHGQTQVRSILHTEFFTGIGEHWSYIAESFNSVVITVVNGQRITAFVNDCLCGIKAITQYVFKFCS